MVPMRRALRLVIDGKAEVVETDADRVVRSERLTLPRPIVIRLMKFIHVPRRFRRQVTNTFLFARDRYRCQYCGRPATDLKPREGLTRDHLVPLSRGGTNDWSNVVTACGSCNTRKANRLPARNRNAPAGAARRAALRALELGGSSPDTHAGALYPAVLRRGYAASVGRAGAAKRGGLAPATKDSRATAPSPYTRKVLERAS